MNYKILICSDMALAGQLDFKLSDLLNVFASAGAEVSKMEMIGFNKEACASAIDDAQESLIVFCENKYLDEIIIDNIQKLGSDKEMVDELAVVFKKESDIIAFFPIDLDWRNLLVKVLEERKDKELKYCKFHLFGKSVESVNAELNKLQQENDSLKFSVLGSQLLTDIYASYKGEDNLIDNEQAKIASLFRDNLYSENDLELCQIVFELLRIRNLKISIMEGVTGGKIISKLYSKAPNFGQVLSAGKIGKTSELDPEKIYNEAYNFLKVTLSDVVLVSSGAFDEKGLSTLLAIGDKKSIHVYKNRFNASREDCLDMAANCALFHLVKKLRQNDFAF